MASDLGDTAPALDASDDSLRAEESTNKTMKGSGSVPEANQNGADAANNDNSEEGERLVVSDKRTLSPLELLIPAIMVYLLEFVDLPTRIKLAAGSTALSRLIYQQCSALWVTIELSDLTLSLVTRFLITDDMLAALLRRVNARITTKVLVLDRCSSLRGNGLEPLRHSRVMERVFIHSWRRPPRFSIATSTNILRTILPHNLTEVQFPYSDNEETLKNKFLLKLREAVHQRAIDQGTACVACHHPVQDVSRQTLPSTHGLPSTRCYACLRLFCRASTCPEEVRDCKYCGEASCSECRKFKVCDGCQDTICTDCGQISEDCIYCKKKFCFPTCNGHNLTCGDCKKTVCTDCSKMHGDDSIHPCGNGDSTHCSDCKKHVTCDCCEEILCVEPDWEFDTTCDGCKKSMCSDCTDQDGNDTWGCQVCEKRFCGECREVCRCPCQIAFCSQQECRDYHFKECTFLRRNKRARTDDNIDSASP